VNVYLFRDVAVTFSSRGIHDSLVVCKHPVRSLRLLHFDQRSLTDRTHSRDWIVEAVLAA